MKNKQTNKFNFKDYEYKLPPKKNYDLYGKPTPTPGWVEVEKRKTELESGNLKPGEILNITSMNQANADYLVAFGKECMGCNGKIIDGSAHTLPPSDKVWKDMTESNQDGNYIQLQVDKYLTDQIIALGRDNEKAVFPDNRSRTTFTDESSGVIYIYEGDNVWNVYFPDRSKAPG